jgi:hypothetical protein
MHTDRSHRPGRRDVLMLNIEPYSLHGGADYAVVWLRMHLILEWASRGREGAGADRRPDQDSAYWARSG